MKDHRINIRTNSNILTEIKEVLDNAGMTISSLIEITLHQIIINNKVPFDMKKESVDLKKDVPINLRINYDDFEKCNIILKKQDLTLSYVINELFLLILKEKQIPFIIKC